MDFLEGVPGRRTSPDIVPETLRLIRENPTGLQAEPRRVMARTLQGYQHRPQASGLQLRTGIVINTNWNNDNNPFR